MGRTTRDGGVRVQSVAARAPGKVNLQLSVGGRRHDGYHDLMSVFQAVGIYDEVRATRGESGAGVTVTVEGDGAEQVPTDGTNLAVRAALCVADEAGVEADVDLHITKTIPVAGGMAGGSADAAAALVACDILWEAGLDRPALLELGAALGSDVPFALVGGTAVGTGRGDRLTPALARGEYRWVFALAEGGLSTPEVFAECDRLRGANPVVAPRVSDRVMSALRSGDAHALGRALTNDLQPAALSLMPRLRNVLEVGAKFTALGGVVSGSGPTCAFLARDDLHHIELLFALSSTRHTRTAKRATGPVHGARAVEGSVR